MNASKTLVVAAINGMLCIILGAFGAHALKSMLSEYLLKTFETAVQYHMYHSLALLAVGILMSLKSESVSLRTLTRSALCFLLGILLFCGSLYGLTLSALVVGDTIKWLGIITPFGGTLFIIGWGLLAASAVQTKRIQAEKP